MLRYEVVGVYARAYDSPRGFWGSPYSRLAVALLLAGRYLHADKLASAGYGRYVLRTYG